MGQPEETPPMFPAPHQLLPSRLAGWKDHPHPGKAGAGWREAWPTPQLQGRWTPHTPASTRAHQGRASGTSVSRTRQLTHRRMQERPAISRALQPQVQRTWTGRGRYHPKGCPSHQPASRQEACPCFYRKAQSGRTTGTVRGTVRGSTAGHLPSPPSPRTRDSCPSQHLRLGLEGLPQPRAHAHPTSLSPQYEEPTHPVKPGLPGSRLAASLPLAEPTSRKLCGTRVPTLPATTKCSQAPG